MPLVNIIKESEVLRIVKEDILEVLGRENKEIPLKFMFIINKRNI